MPISSWALAGQECRHNQLYWSQGDYLGVGAAAHGHEDGRRWWNVRTPERYIERVGSGESPEAGFEELDSAGRAEEAFAMGLRTRSGAPVHADADETVAALERAGMLVRVGQRVVLSVRGRLLASDVTARLLIAGAAAGLDAERVAAQGAAGTRYH